jgi:hypothetical protein
MALQKETVLMWANMNSAARHFASEVHQESAERQAAVNQFVGQVHEMNQ